MKKIQTILILTNITLFLFSCKNTQNNADASGAFEAEETIISSEASGTIKQFNLEEGQVLQAGQLIGYIDSTQLFLKKKQMGAQVKAGLSQRPDIATQMASLQEQLKSAEKEKQRFTNLIKADAAPQKQLDDINTQIEVLKKQIEAQRSSLGIISKGIVEQSLPLQAQIDQINDQLQKCRIINPINGTVLSKYTEANEMATPGKPLYKIADLSTIILRAYITGNQLPIVKLSQQVNVFTDNGSGGYNETMGTIIWISDRAEFTPKTIQTKDERANLVYALKIKVKNNGAYKIGMYGELKF